tara:strand:- start:3247 stop:3996 length:750 start_codon:yes stop_codon:yes gene_type:complete
MENNKQDFPSEIVTLPSKGLLYPKDSPLSKGTIEMKYMTAREEDILTNQNLIEKGTVIDSLLKSLIVTPIDYNLLLTGDKNAILVAARVLGYGKDYSFDYKGETINIDLTTLEDKELDESIVIDGKNEFNFTLPHSEVQITFKLLTHGDEQKLQQELEGLKRINKDTYGEYTTRMKHTITAVNNNSDMKVIREFVDNKLLAIDSRALRNHMKEIQPDINLSFDHEDNRGNITKISVPIGLDFFWPDVEL